MNEAMMQQITNDRLNNAWKQAEAHRQATRARGAGPAAKGGVVDKVSFRQGPGIASKLRMAVKQLKVHRNFSIGEV